MRGGSVSGQAETAAAEMPMAWAAAVGEPPSKRIAAVFFMDLI